MITNDIKMWILHVKFNSVGVRRGILMFASSDYRCRFITYRMQLWKNEYNIVYSSFENKGRFCIFEQSFWTFGIIIFP